MVDRFRAGKRLWEPEDDALMREYFPHEPTTATAARLRRSVEAVSNRADKLGLHKSTAYLASPAACRLRRGDNIGKAFRFPKGHVPANKGTRRPGWWRGRMQDTWFKPGRRSGKAAANHMPVGSTRLIDGYVYRKVSDVANVPYSVNWKPEHHLLWTATHGPIPAGHALAFKNGNKLDVRLDNLQLITRRELMARNTIHTWPKPLADTVMLIGALNRQIRMRGADAEKQDR